MRNLKKNQMEIPVFHKGDKLSETNNDLKPVSFLLQTIFKVHTKYFLVLINHQMTIQYFLSFIRNPA